MGNRYSIKNILKKRFMKGETIRNEWVRSGWDRIVSTQTRLLFVRESVLDKSYVEVPYSHITSLHYGKVRSLKTMIIAVLLWAAALMIYLYRSPFVMRDYAMIISGFLTFLGIILAILFAMGRTRFTIHINGRKPIRLNDDLTELWRYIREGESKD